jgi:putative endonuclease
VTSRRGLPVARASAGHSRGRKAEQAASDYLVACGFVVLGQNVRLGPLEIDLVARRDDLVALVEVRTRRRGSQVGALASIGPVKRKRLLRAAERYLFEPPFPLEGVTRVRLDVCIVHTSSEAVTIEHFPGAITADGA